MFQMSKDQSPFQVEIRSQGVWQKGCPSDGVSEKSWHDRSSNLSRKCAQITTTIFHTIDTPALKLLKRNGIRCHPEA